MTHTPIGTRLWNVLGDISRKAMVHQRRLGRAVFVLGLGVYFMVNIGLVAFRVHSRVTPLHVDDSYEYIIKAVEMETCFRQNCAALNDLRAQLDVPSSDSEMAWVRYREYTRAFLVYHPLHSALVILLRDTGLSWEHAYEGVRVAGSVLIIVAVAYWVLALFGSGPAGFALLFLSLIFFYDQGLHYVVPSNMALGIAMLLWARISARRGAAPWSLAIGVLAMAAMHPIGRLYGIAAILLFLLFPPERGWSRSRIAGLLVSIAVLTAAFLLPVLVHHPDLTVRPDPPLSNWPTSGYGILLYGILDNFSVADRVLKEWFALYGAALSAVVLTVFGFFSVNRVRRSAIFKNGIVLASLAAASGVYVLPRYPAELFHRVWIPVAILLTGATGAAAWSLLAGACAFFAGRQGGMQQGWSSVDGGISWPVSRNWTAMLMMTGALLLAVRLENGVSQTLHYLTTVELPNVRKDLWIFDPEQPRQMLAATSPSSKILYLDEVPMHFYFTYGAMSRGAVFYPGLAGPASFRLLEPARDYDSIRIPEKVSIRDVAHSDLLRSGEVQLFVGWNPVTFAMPKEGRLALSRTGSVQYSSPRPAPLNNLKVRLSNPGGEAEVEVAYGSQTATARVPPHWSGWLAMPQSISTEPQSEFRLTVSADLFLLGMRLSDTDLDWPWDQNAVLTFSGENSKTIRFVPDELMPVQDLDVYVKVLNDSGSTLLGELVPGRSQQMTNNSSR